MDVSFGIAAMWFAAAGLISGNWKRPILGQGIQYSHNMCATLYSMPKEGNGGKVTELTCSDSFRIGQNKQVIMEWISLTDMKTTRTFYGMAGLLEYGWRLR